MSDDLEPAASPSEDDERETEERSPQEIREKLEEARERRDKRFYSGQDYTNAGVRAALEWVLGEREVCPID